MMGNGESGNGQGKQKKLCEAYDPPTPYLIYTNFGCKVKKKKF